MSNVEVLNALLYVLENGCKWRGLPSEYGNHSCPSQDQIARFDEYQSASGWHGSIKKSGKQSIGRSRGGWNTKIHMVAASDRNAVIFELSAGQAGDAPEGRKLLKKLGRVQKRTFLLMDRAYEGDETRMLTVELGYVHSRCTAQIQPEGTLGIR